MELESVLIQNQSHYVVVLRERIFGDDGYMKNGHQNIRFYLLLIE